MSSNDHFRNVLFNAGEQGIAEDFNKLQRQQDMRFMDGFLMSALRNPVDPSGANHTDPEMADLAEGASSWMIQDQIAMTPFPGRGFVVPAGAKQLTFGSRGVLIQLRDSSSFGEADEDEADIYLQYRCTPSDGVWTTDDGDVSNPRIDVLQMKLDRVDDGLESRAYSQAAQSATFLLGTYVPGFFTIIRVKVGGKGGNNYTLSFVADGAGVGSVTKSGNNYVFHYQSGVTTALNFESAVVSSMDGVFEISNANPTPSDVFVSPAATFAATHFSGGTNQLLVGTSLNKKRRVRATFSIKKGIAAATPTYPLPDTDYVAVAAVYIPTGWTGVHNDNNIRDLRLPIGGIEVHDVYSRSMWLDTDQSVAAANWTRAMGKWYATGPTAAGGGIAYAVCPSGGSTGRLIGIGIHARSLSGLMETHLYRIDYTTGDPTITRVSDLITAMSTPLNGGQTSLMCDESHIQAHRDDIAGTKNGRLGTPLWTNGMPYGPLKNQLFTAGPNIFKKSSLALGIAGYTNDQLHMVRFIVARGIG